MIHPLRFYDSLPTRSILPLENRLFRHYWRHLYRQGYNTGASYLEYIFNAFISGRAGTPEIAGRYLAVFQVLISSRSRYHPSTYSSANKGEEGGGRRCTLCRLERSFNPRATTAQFPAASSITAATCAPLATPLSSIPNTPTATAT